MIQDYLNERAKAIMDGFREQIDKDLAFQPGIEPGKWSRELRWWERLLMRPVIPYPVVYRTDDEECEAGLLFAWRWWSWRPRSYRWIPNPNYVAAWQFLLAAHAERQNARMGGITDDDEGEWTQ